MKKKEIFWGFIFILAAILIIANQFGFMPEISAFEAVATVILGAIIIKSLLKLNFWGVLFPLAGISIIYADELNITEFTPWPALLTALLLSIGLSLIFKRNYYWHGHFHFDNKFRGNEVNVQNDSIVDCSVSFGESIKYVNSEQFERANIKCSFGEAKVYFDNAQIPSGKADIYVDVSFGEATLFIPKTWKVIHDIHGFIGDIKETNRNLGLESPVVTIRGSVNFGDIKIIYV